MLLQMHVDLELPNIFQYYECNSLFTNSVDFLTIISINDEQNKNSVIVCAIWTL